MVVERQVAGRVERVEHQVADLVERVVGRVVDQVGQYPYEEAEREVGLDHLDFSKFFIIK